MPNPLCFVLMPFGKNRMRAASRLISTRFIATSSGRPFVRPVWSRCADEDLPEDIIHKPTFERLILCDVALAGI